LPGVAQEQLGIIRKGAQLVAAYANAEVPKITVLLRKGYGGAYIALDSMAIGATAVYAWPTARISIMGAEGAVDVLYRRELARFSGNDYLARRQQLIESFAANSPGVAAALKAGQITALIEPEQTRETLISALGVSGSDAG